MKKETINVTFPVIIRTTTFTKQIEIMVLVAAIISTMSIIVILVGIANIRILSRRNEEIRKILDQY